MLEKFINSSILQALPFDANEQQRQLIDKLSEFIVRREDRKVFLLKGYAGTGKTSIMAALVRAMEHFGQRVVLLAPTGRAAKVLAHYAGENAFTIHKYIYRLNKLGEEGFSIADNRERNVLFIVDEASMLSGKREVSRFGSGMVLDDLIQYVYSGTHCSLLLLGDEAQLPPVGSLFSPALDEDYMKGYDLHIYSHILTQVARQALDSGILRNATAIRDCIGNHETFQLDYCEDVWKVEPEKFVELLEQSLSDVGESETLVLTQTNKRTNLYNQGIRGRILYKEGAIESGDRIMVTKNNYYFSQDYDDLPFLANGDTFSILRLRNEREMYGFHFVDASLRALDYDWEIDAILWLDTLNTDTPEQNYALQRTLFERVAEDYPEYAKNKRKMIEAVYSNAYYNALQIRFAYAVTCHKAQGGQWEHVYIDPGFRPQDEDETGYLRWLYTAITRAKRKVFIVGGKKEGK